MTTASPQMVGVLLTHSKHSSINRWAFLKNLEWCFFPFTSLFNTMTKNIQYNDIWNAHTQYKITYLYQYGKEYMYFNRNHGSVFQSIFLGNQFGVLGWYDSRSLIYLYIAILYFRFNVPQFTKLEEVQ